MCGRIVHGLDIVTEIKKPQPSIPVPPLAKKQHEIYRKPGPRSQAETPKLICVNLDQRDVEPANAHTGTAYQIAGRTDSSLQSDKSAISSQSSVQSNQLLEKLLATVKHESLGRPDELSEQRSVTGVGACAEMETSPNARAGREKAESPSVKIGERERETTSDYASTNDQKPEPWEILMESQELAPEASLANDYGHDAASPNSFECSEAHECSGDASVAEQELLKSYDDEYRTEETDELCIHDDDDDVESPMTEPENTESTDDIYIETAVQVSVSAASTTAVVESKWHHKERLDLYDQKAHQMTLVEL